MKIDHYIVRFVGHKERDVYAYCSEMAITLARAEQTIAGLDPNVISVQKDGQVV
jgi:hypothetical protein